MSFRVHIAANYSALPVCFLLLAAGLACAQPYPAKSIRVVVGFQAGGGVDMSARAIGKYLTEAVGQPIVVDNKPGAAGNIAANLVAKSAADGYTLLMSNSTIAIPSLFANLPFDVRKDFDPVSLVAIGPSVLTVHPSMTATNVTELINLAKAKPKQLIYGSGGVGNITHLEMELLQVMTGIQMIHVPYKGSAPSVIGLMGGEVNMIFSSVPAALAQIKSGRMKALAVSTLQRSSALPDVPTLNESGLPGYDAASWYGLFAPAGTPKKILAALSGEVVKIMRVPDVRERFAGDGFEPAGQGPADFAKFLREEIAKWARVVKTADIKPE
jgi:tripartite-type tricarboxylate transporter receptor subunit TctC